jgi:oligopeptide/dipeptide ABC transporter ATP-binding protein
MIELRDLSVAFPAPSGGFRHVLHGISLGIRESERMGLVGESGSGKSLTAMACLGLVPEPGRIVGGSVAIDGDDLRDASPATLRAIRGRRIGLVLQEAAGAFNPVYTVGFQIREAVRVHRGTDRRRGREIALDLLQTAALEEPEAVFDAYPHELSGGQAQRAMLALALAGSPRFLIADEPTSELDVVTRSEVLELVTRLSAKEGLGLLLISHDLAAVRGSVQRLAVMYAGRIVEDGPADRLFARPLHPYTQDLLAAAEGRTDRDATPAAPLPVPAASGCPFAPRCQLARRECREVEPGLVVVGPQRRLRCPVVGGEASEAPGGPA